MAVAIPIALSLAGVSAGTVIGAGLVLGALGVNAKIDQAASRVFGRDLTRVANLAGAVVLGAGAGDAAAGWGALTGSAGAAAAPAAVPGVLPQAAGAMDAAAQAGVAGAGGATAAVEPWTQAAGATGQGFLSSFRSLPGPTQAALVQVGGQAVAGASGAMAERDAQRAADRRQADQDRRFRSGSGIRFGQNASYRPRSTISSGGM